MKNLVTLLVLMTTSYSVAAQAETCEQLRPNAEQVSILEPKLRIALINMKLAVGQADQNEALSITKDLTASLHQVGSKTISTLFCHAANGTIQFLNDPKRSMETIRKLNEIDRKLDGGYVLSEETRVAVDEAYKALGLSRSVNSLINSIDMKSINSSR